MKLHQTVVTKLDSTVHYSQYMVPCYYSLDIQLVQQVCTQLRSVMNMYPVNNQD